MTITKAREIANKYLDILKPYCKRIEIAGSIRREKEEVKDIEIVCIPDSWKLELYFKDNPLNLALLKDGEKYKKIVLKEGMMLDLFIATEKNWGIIFLIRTGSAEFNISLMKKMHEKGYFCEKGIIYQGGNCCSTEIEDFEPVEGLKEEEDIFKLLDMAYIQPKQRI